LHNEPLASALVQGRERKILAFLEYLKAICRQALVASVLEYLRGLQESCRVGRGFFPAHQKHECNPSGRYAQMRINHLAVGTNCRSRPACSTEKKRWPGSRNPATVFILS
jgi:hypothetical protein